MGNNPNSHHLYNPNVSIVIDHQSAILKSSQLQTKRKSDNVITPLLTNEKPGEKSKRILEKLKENNQIYKDLEFPAENTSIADDIKAFLPNIPENQLFWERPSIIFTNNVYKLFKDEIIPNDIIQGYLGDCYLLSSLAALAEKPSLILNLFESKENNNLGFYSIRLCIDGQWQNIIIDDYFPLIRGFNPKETQFIFSRSNGPELWVLLIEKAYAKVHGSYQRIEKGDCEEALRDLTGAAIDKIYNFTEKEAWEILKKADEHGFLIVVASEFEKNEGGIISGHCYSVLDLKEVKNINENIIKLRNPWGHKEWVGDWSDESEKWTEDLRKELNWEKKNDGVFWMSLKDFCAYFTEINICQIYENFLYSSLSINIKNYKVIMFEIKNKCKNERNLAYLTCSQFDKRKMGKNYDYCYIRMFLCRYENDEVGFLEENSGRRRDLYMKIEGLVEGIYVMFCEIENLNKNKNIVISGYSDILLDFKEIEVDRTVFLEGLFINYVKNRPIKEKIIQYYEKERKIQRIIARIADYTFICYMNDSESLLLKEELIFNQSENFYDIENKPIDKKYEVNIKPLEKYILKFKSLLQTKEAFGSFKFHSSSMLIWMQNLEQMALEAIKNPFKVLQRKINDSPIEVFVYVVYKAGILGFLFSNKMEKGYREVLSFQTKNLKAKNFDENKIIVRLEPQKTFFIFFEVIEQNLEIYYKMRYIPIIC